jgi:hypothetical protein
MVQISVSLSQPQGQSAARRIISMKITIFIIGKISAVPQMTAT